MPTEIVMPSSLRRSLPFLNGLAVFESAARLMSFSRAAEEIGVSQSAVSRHVARLEDHLGTRLFHRKHHTLSLTSTGAKLLTGVQSGLETVLDAVNSVRAPIQGRRVAIGCSFDTGHLWLLPHLGMLEQRIGGREIEMKVSDDYREFDDEAVTVSLRYGTGSWPGFASRLLAPAVLIPVATPAFVRKVRLRAGRDGPEYLVSMPLIQYEGTSRDAYDWRGWLSRCGVSPSRRLKRQAFPRLMFVMDAVLQGRGVALVWQHVVARSLRTGQLVRIGSAEVSTEGGLYAVWRENRALSALAQKLVEGLAQIGT